MGSLDYVIHWRFSSSPPPPSTSSSLNWIYFPLVLFRSPTIWNNKATDQYDGRGEESLIRTKPLGYNHFKNDVTDVSFEFFFYWTGGHIFRSGWGRHRRTHLLNINESASASNYSNKILTLEAVDQSDDVSIIRGRKRGEEGLSDISDYSKSRIWSMNWLTRRERNDWWVAETESIGWSWTIELDGLSG